MSKGATDHPDYPNQQRYVEKTMNTESKPLIIYHGNCADGFAAAWCFWKKYGDDGADYFAGVYQKPAPDVTGREVYLLDFSYKRQVVESMLSAAQSVTLIDHHKTAIEDLEPLRDRMNWFCDIERSGATLAWDYLYPGQDRPLLLGHIEDRDLWRFNLPGTREIQAFVFAEPYDFSKWDKLMNADQVELLSMTAAGAAIERKHHKDISELLKVCQRTMTIAGYPVPVASLPYTMVSDAAHIMCQGEKFAACYWDTEATRNFGLRSAPDGMDVSEIAKIFGGGGHKHAAGFSVPRDHYLATA